MAPVVLVSPSCPAQAQYPRMTSVDIRVGTFDVEGWPHDEAAFLATPETLAEEGFFCSPTSLSPDRTICYCCGVALSQWQPTDVPRIEHRKHSPGCQLLKAGGASSASGTGSSSTTATGAGKKSSKEAQPFEFAFQRLLRKRAERRLKSAAEGSSYPSDPEAFR